MMKTMKVGMIASVGSRGLFPTQKQCTGYPCRLLCSARKRKGLSSVKKTTEVLKKAMSEKSEKWKSREWYGTTKTRWQQPAGNSGGQSSLDAWEHAKPKGKWKEVSAEYEAINALVKEKKITWHKSGKESSKREADHTMVESAATDEKYEERSRDKLSDWLEEFRERNNEEDEVRCLIEEMQRNLEAAQNKSYEAEQRLCSALREYVDTFH